jgi:hypothetical protein
MSGRYSRSKGHREELALVRALQANGFAAEKASRTGFTGPDISMPLLNVDRRIEVKVRSRGFEQLYAWLANRDILIFRGNRRQPLVILPLKLAAEIAAVAERNKKQEEAPT